MYNGFDLQTTKTYKISH